MEGGKEGEVGKQQSRYGSGWQKETKDTHGNADIYGMEAFLLYN